MVFATYVSHVTYQTVRDIHAHALKHGWMSPTVPWVT
jgi:hypothetical protein